MRIPALLTVVALMGGCASVDITPCDFDRVYINEAGIAMTAQCGPVFYLTEQIPSGTKVTRAMVTNNGYTIDGNNIRQSYRFARSPLEHPDAPSGHQYISP